jgi:general L-amino acid transport system permease protein
MSVASDTRATSGESLWRNEFFRGIILQMFVAFLIVAAAAFFIHNTAVNLDRRGISSGFGFLNNIAGFQPTFSLIPFELSTSSNARIFLVGLINTLVVSAIGIVLTTLIGFIIGVARLSGNYLIRKLAAVYVDVIRNIPLLAQIIFWYFGVLATLPSVRDSGQGEPILGFFYLNKRGLFMPAPIVESGGWGPMVGLVLGIAAAVATARWAHRRQMLTGRQFHTVWAGLGLVVIVPMVVSLVSGFSMNWSLPALKGFNFQGGMVILPEFVALLLALTIYTAAFIAENVRSGVQAVSHGQTEAAYALGLRPRFTTQLIILPQALRVIVPPLTSQYLNLTKNSTLGVIIAYPDLVSVFTGTVQNQTGQAVECVALTMAVYLVISLVVSAFMNWYNRYIALVER